MNYGTEARVLILEDNESRQGTLREVYPNAVIVDSAVRAIENLQEYWDLIFPDHDLHRHSMPGSSLEDCGYEVVRYILEQRPEHLHQSRFVVHSANPQRSRIMVEDLLSAGYDAEHRPFMNLLQQLKNVISSRIGDNPER